MKNSHPTRKRAPRHAATPGPRPPAPARPQRFPAIDICRALLIGLMIMLNWASDVKGLPSWFYHAHARADLITLADYVFAGFIFVMGMAMPHSFERRWREPGGPWKLPLHVLARTAGLLLLGSVMASMERGLSHDMILPFPVWRILFFTGIFLFWGPPSPLWLRVAGGLGLAAALAVFRHKGPQGSVLWIKPYWWGILGMLGWAYFFSFIAWALCLGRRLPLLLAMAAMLWLYHAERRGLAGVSWFWLGGLAGSHAAAAVAGMILGISLARPFPPPAILGLIWGSLLGLLGFAIRPLYIFSKISGTPSWSMACAGATSLAFALVQFLTQSRPLSPGERFLALAGHNALLAYLLPDLGMALVNLLKLGGFNLWPLLLRHHSGWPGAAFSCAWALAWLGVAALAAKKGFIVKL